MTKEEKSKLTVILNKLSKLITSAEPGMTDKELVEFGKVERRLEALTR